jgi:hypothetical protein
METSCPSFGKKFGKGSRHQIGFPNLSLSSPLLFQDGRKLRVVHFGSTGKYLRVAEVKKDGSAGRAAGDRLTIRRSN